MGQFCLLEDYIFYWYLIRKLLLVLSNKMFAAFLPSSFSSNQIGIVLMKYPHVRQHRKIVDIPHTPTNPEHFT